MKVTPRLKEKLVAAKTAGYENLYRIVGAYRATTYCVFHPIDKILDKPDGYDYGSGRPYPSEGMWTGHPNTRMVDNKDIMYSEVFHKF